MATQTLTQRETDASVAAAMPIAALAGGTPTTPVILALDLGHRSGWARDPSHLDSIVDVAGYAACLREVTRA